MDLLHPFVNTSWEADISNTGFALLFVTLIVFIFFVCSIRTNMIFVAVFALLDTSLGCLTGSYWQLAQGNTAEGDSLTIVSVLVRFPEWKDKANAKKRSRAASSSRPICSLGTCWQVSCYSLWISLFYCQSVISAPLFHQCRVSSGQGRGARSSRLRFAAARTAGKAIFSTSCQWRSFWL